MQESPEQIITDEQIDSCWGNAQFGPDATRREVVNSAVLKYAAGYATGHTIWSICKELRLVTVNYNLTTLGRRYLYAAFSGKLSVWNYNCGQGADDASWSDQEGVLLSNKEALETAATLERLLPPDAVAAAISRLNYTELDSTLKFAAIDQDLGFYCFDSKPVKHKVFGIWVLSGSTEKSPSLRKKILDPFKFPLFEWEHMIFHRTESGWVWIGDPNNNTDEQ